MRGSMNESADYRLYNEVADYVENELIVKASQQVKSGTTRLQYQSYQHNYRSQ